LRACSAHRGKFDAGDVGSVFVSEIAYGPAKTGAKVGDRRSGTDLRVSRQFVRGVETTIVVLVVRIQVFRAQVVEMTAACSQFGDDDVALDGMTIVEIKQLRGGVIHENCSEVQIYGRTLEGGRLTDRLICSRNCTEKFGEI
jgi:hypothetical protein